MLLIEPKAEDLSARIWKACAVALRKSMNFIYEFHLTSANFIDCANDYG